jgi:hypothetical protein
MSRSELTFSSLESFAALGKNLPSIAAIGAASQVNLRKFHRAVFRGDAAQWVLDASVEKDKAAYSVGELHEVRSHLRRLGGGRMVTVRAHKRGDAKNGVRMSHYSVN